MAITVTVTPRDASQPEAQHRGENVTVGDGVIRVWTEPHEVKPGGLVDLFVGDIIPLDTVAVARVRRV